MYIAKIKFNIHTFKDSERSEATLNKMFVSYDPLNYRISICVQLYTSYSYDIYRHTFAINI